MRQQFLAEYSLKLRVWGLVLAMAACAFLLTSCATTQPVAQTTTEPVFKFTVMLYKQPVEVANWKYDPAQSGNPEGSALNIITAMQHGDWDHWQASWEPGEQPKASPQERADMIRTWQRLKNDRVTVIGRVIAGTDLVLELSMHDPASNTSEKMHLPLKHSQDQWWLSSMDTNSEFLNWETSSNKIMAYRESFALETYLRSVKH